MVKSLKTTLAVFAVSAFALLFVGVQSAAAVTVSELVDLGFTQSQAAIVLQLLGGSSSNSSSSSCTATYNHTVTLRRGSNGSQVMALQSALGLSLVDGIFGGGTEAAVRAFQTSNGLVADGIVGPNTGSKVSMASQTNCAGNGSTGSTGSTGFLGGDGEGQLTSLTEVAPDDTSIDEGEDDVVILRIEGEADDADQMITRVDVDFQAADSSESDKPWDYFSEVALVFNDEVVASMDADSASDWDRDESGSPDIFSMRFSDIELVVEENEEFQLGIMVSARNNVDSGDLGQSWEAEIPQNGIRAVSPNGLSETYVGSGGLNEDFTVASSDTGTLEFLISDNDIDSGIIFLDATNTTDKSTVFIWDVEADNQDILLKDFSVDLTMTDADAGGELTDIDGAVTKAYLYFDGDLVGTETVSTADLTDEPVLFDNIDVMVNDGDKKEMMLKLKFTNLDGTPLEAGDTILAEIDASDSSAEEASGPNDGDSITPTGDIAGETHYLYVDAPEVTLVSVSNSAVSVADIENTTDDVTVTFVYDVKAIGADIYVDGTVTEDGDGTYAAGQGNSYYVTRADTGATAASLTDVSAALTSNADSAANTTWKVSEGQTKRFTLTVNVANTLTDDGADDKLPFQVNIMSIGWDTSAIAATANNYTFSLEDFENSPVFLGELDAA